MTTVDAAGGAGSSAAPRWDAIIIAGGRASRLGGVDKARLVYHGRSLLQRALDSVRFADRVSVVGYDGSLSPTPRLRRTEEEPKWAGPAAALVAGIASLGDELREYTTVLAGDLPRAAAGVAQLVTTITTRDVRDGVVAIDSGGHRQYLLAIYRTSSLVAAASEQESTTNLSMRRLVGSLDLTEVQVRDDVCADIDTPLDAAALGINLPIDAAAERQTG